MPRSARVKSNSGLYHVMLRGVNKQNLFEDDEDRRKFIEILVHLKQVSDSEMLAYCLMSNHVHLLIKENKDSVSTVVKRISGSYVFWYNKKYDRCGHLFQDRFKSEVVETDTYFLTVLRYIHQNPVQAGISKDPVSFPWSSYHEYIGQTKIVDTEFGLKLFSEDREKAKDLFINFMNEKNEDQCLDEQAKGILSDQEIQDYLKQLGIMNSSDLQRLDKHKQDSILYELKQKHGVSIRRLASLTGLSKSVIERSGQRDSEPVHLPQSLCSDCEHCFGFCCVALYFSASEGFPVDKEAGRPCHNLQNDFRCSVHDQLVEQNLKGCLAFDCFGAGPKVAQISFAGQDWRENPDSAVKMFEVFLIVRQIHELLWYLTQALALQAACPIYDELQSLLDETERLTYLPADALLELDVSRQRAKVDKLLKMTSELVRAGYSGSPKNPGKRRKRFGRGADLVAADLRNEDLRGANLRSALLIAADLRGLDLRGTDFIGADFRDADLSGADLSQSIFLTQAQINAAKGDASTKVPPMLSRPCHWLGTES